MVWLQHRPNPPSILVTALNGSKFDFRPRKTKEKKKTGGEEREGGTAEELKRKIWRIMRSLSI